MITLQRQSYRDEDVYALLRPLVRDWFGETFEKFSPPQRGAIPLIHRRENCLIAAPTGTGKTLSAFLAILNELVALSERDALAERVYCTYISPLKALSNDIERNLTEPLRALAERAEGDLGIRVQVRTGDTTASQKARMLKKPPHILITTPESFAIVLSSPKFSEHLSRLDWLIVDEIHALAENKRGVHLSLSLERLQEKTDFARVGLSATISPLEEIARFLVGRRYGRALGEGLDDPWRDCTIVDARFDRPMDLQVVSPVRDFIKASGGALTGSLYKTIGALMARHRSTIVFTNTRSGTERLVHELKERYPKHAERIGAHHSSLSKERRFSIERRLKAGEMKCVVSSTSLELGVDIGSVDLVILMGSPKSVIRALQRVGRSGHRLSETVKGRVVVTGRDDLVECAVMLKSALERRLDRIHLPRNCLDVLAQQSFGLLLDGPRGIDDLWEWTTRSYSFSGLSRDDFDKTLDYLAGEYASLEDRHVYAKVYVDRERGVVGKRGKLARVIYNTNVGTIPDESYITVKQGDTAIGHIEEAFLEKLRQKDVFVLGGDSFRFRYSRGMTVQVEGAGDHDPTVPSWYSEMLPLSYELALDIQDFRQELADLFEAGTPPEEIKDFVRAQLALDERGVESLYAYFHEQHRYALIPHRRRVLIEYYQEGAKSWVVFHTLFGRRVNDVLSRAVASLIARREDRDVELSLTDHGFYVAYEGSVKVMDAVNLLQKRDLRETVEDALKSSEILRRRFRHCATRAFMILRAYRGRRKSVGTQQMRSFILQHVIERMDAYFPILREAYREVLEDAMDIDNAERVLNEIKSGRIRITAQVVKAPSPFAFHLLMQGRMDLVKVEDRQAFLQRMHAQLTGT